MPSPDRPTPRNDPPQGSLGCSLVLAALVVPAGMACGGLLSGELRWVFLAAGIHSSALALASAWGLGWVVRDPLGTLRKDEEAGEDPEKDRRLPEPGAPGGPPLPRWLKIVDTSRHGAFAVVMLHFFALAEVEPSPLDQALALLLVLLAFALLWLSWWGAPTPVLIGGDLRTEARDLTR